MSQINYTERFYWLNFSILKGEKKIKLINFLTSNTDFEVNENLNDINIFTTNLDFYEHTSLIIIQDHQSKYRKKQTEFLLHNKPKDELKEDNLHPLYRRANEIHAFNKSINFKLTSKKKAAAYIRFFTEAIEGSKNPFYIIDNTNYYPSNVTRGEDKNDIDAAIEKHGYLKTSILKRIKKEKNKFHVEVAILHGDNLWQANISVDTKGMVEMTGDLPLDPAVGLSNHEKSEYDHFILIKKKNFLEVSSKDFENALLSESIEEFNKILQLDSKPVLDGIISVLKVKGSVNFDGQTIKIPLKLPYPVILIFEGDVIFKNTTFLSYVNLNNCRTINGILSFQSSTVFGSLNLNNFIVNKPQYFNTENASIICNNTTVKEDFHASSLQIMHGTFNLLHAKINGSLYVTNSIIDKDLNLFSIHVEGLVKLSNSLIYGHLSLRSAFIRTDLDLNSIKVFKSLNCRAINVGISIGIYGSLIKGDLDLAFANIGGGLFIRLNNSTSTIIEGNLQLSGINCNGGHIEIVGSKIHGSLLMLSPINIGSLYIKGKPSGVGGFSKFIYCEIDWGIYISNLALNGILSCYGLSVGGTRNIPDKNLNQGDFQLINCNINGDINFSLPDEISIDIAYFIKTNNKLFNVLSWGQKEDDIEQIPFKNITEGYGSVFPDLITLNIDNILDYIRFYFHCLFKTQNKRIHLIENVKDLIWDNEVFNNDIIQTKIKPLKLLDYKNNKYTIEVSYIDSKRNLNTGVVIVNENAITKGEHIIIKSNWKSKKRLKIPLFRIFKNSHYDLDKLLNNNDDFWSEISGLEKNTFLKQASGNSLFNNKEYFNRLFKGDLPFFKNGELFAIKADLVALKYPTEVQGNLLFSTLKVYGNLYLNNIKTTGKIEFSQTVINGDLQIKALKADFSDKTHIQHANCSNFNMESIEITGDANINGLKVIKRGNYKGVFNAKSAKIKGSLNFLDNKLNTSIKVSGSIDLSNTEIGNLSLSKEVFLKNNESLNSKQKLNFINRVTNLFRRKNEENSIEKFTLILERLKANFFDWKGDFPNYINTKIRDIEVGAWSEDGLNNLKQLLITDNSNELKRNTYTKLELTLRNQGYEENAEDVYKEMWKRIKNQKINGRNKPLRSRILSSFRAWFGYGRKQAITCFILFLIFIFISGIVFSNPKNIVSSNNNKSNENTSNLSYPKNEEWGLGNSLWFTLRYNIPIIPFTALEQWKPNTEKIVFLNYKSTKISAQHYAHIVELSHWIIWSIFLIYLSGIIRRGEGK